MSILQRIRRWWIGSQQNNAYTCNLDEPLHLGLTNTAAQEKYSPNEGTLNPLAVGLTHHRNSNDLYQRWLSLSAREQDVAALTCLGYTNRQIAFRLGISVETVKSYLRNVFYKFDTRSKPDLRVSLANWDFSAWHAPRH